MQEQTRRQYKTFKIFLLGFLLTFSLNTLEAKTFKSYTVYGKVVAVVDGDTLKVREFKTRNEVYYLRLAGIDAPEKNQIYGSEATQLAQDFVLNRPVKIVVTDIDPYQRKVGYVYILVKRKHETETSLNHKLMAQGLAWFYKEYSKDMTLKELEEKAQNLKLGIWSESDPVPPWVFRKKPKTYLNIP